jgi:NAD(P)-binding Rossmann-like domain/Flavin containing amine oxidoreductase
MEPIVPIEQTTPTPTLIPIPIPISYLVSHWCTDPYTLGGWSLLTPNAKLNTRRILQEPIITTTTLQSTTTTTTLQSTTTLTSTTLGTTSSSESDSTTSIRSITNDNINKEKKHNHIYLCGEYTNPTQAGMVHGAYQEGVRVGTVIWEQFQQRQQQQNQQDKCYNVIIIGAGAAGLGCAYQIQKYNNESNNTNFSISLTILEARDRIGGRVRTEEITIVPTQSNNNNINQEQQKQSNQEQEEKVVTDDEKNVQGKQQLPTTTTSSSSVIAVELGANWLQQGYDNKNPLHDIATNELHLHIVPTNFLKPTEYPQHLQVSSTRSEQIMMELIRRCHQCCTTINNDNDNKNNNSIDSIQQHNEQKQFHTQLSHRSIQDVVDEWFNENDNKNNNNNNNTTDTCNTNNYTKNEIQHVIEGEIIIDTGVLLSKLSCQYGIEPGVGNGDYWIVNGYKQILNYFVQIITSSNNVHNNNKIIYNTTVTTIDSLSSLLTNNIESKIIVTTTTTTTPPATQQQQQEEDTTYEADIVVCCIPSAVLQQKQISTFTSNCIEIGKSNNKEEQQNDMQQKQIGYISFIPPIPKQHQIALDTIITGNVEKIVLCFTKRWWPSSFIKNGGYIRVHHHGDCCTTGTSSSTSKSITNSNNNDNEQRRQQQQQDEQEQFGNVCEWLDCTDIYGTPVITGIFTGPWLSTIWSSSSSSSLSKNDNDYNIAIKATTILYNAIYCNVYPK